MRALMLLAAVAALAAATAPGDPVPMPSPAADSLYALVYTRGPAWDTTTTVGGQSGMREHAANLRRLRAEGRIVLAGRFGDYGLILLRVRGRDDALAALSPDSATARGVFHAQLSPWSTIYEGSVGAP